MAKKKKKYTNQYNRILTFDNVEDDIKVKKVGDLLWSQDTGWTEEGKKSDAYKDTDEYKAKNRKTVESKKTTDSKSTVENKPTVDTSETVFGSNRFNLRGSAKEGNSATQGISPFTVDPGQPRKSKLEWLNGESTGKKTDELPTVKEESQEETEGTTQNSAADWRKVLDNGWNSYLNDLLSRSREATEEKAAETAEEEQQETNSAGRPLVVRQQMQALEDTGLIDSEKEETPIGREGNRGVLEYGEDSFAAQSARAQLEDPDSKLNQVYRARLSRPEDAENYNLAAANEWDAWIDELIGMGQLNNENDIMYWNEDQLERAIREQENKIADIKAGQPKNQEETAEMQHEKDELQGFQGLYEQLRNDGIQLGLQGEYVHERPADYYDDYSYKYAYDQAIYDYIHGTGAYQEVFDRGIDEEIDAVEAEAEDLWTRMENGTLDELGHDNEDLNRQQRELSNAILQDTSAEEAYLGRLQNELDRKRSVRELEENASGDGGYHSELIPAAKKGNGLYMEPQGDSTDQAYYWINVGWAESQKEALSSGLFDLSDVITDESKPHWAQTREEFFLTTEQKETFNKYFNSGDKESAQAYLDGLHDSLLSRKSAYEENYSREAADGDLGWLHGAATIAAQPVVGAVGVYNTIRALLGDEEASNPNSDAWTLGRWSSTTRDERGNVWGQAFLDTFGGDTSTAEIGKWVNGIIYSMADNIMSMATTSGIGDVAGFAMGSKAATGVMQLVMCSEATANTMLQNLNEGKNPWEAAVYAIGDGVIEAITEKYSIEALLSTDPKDLLGNAGQILGYLGKNAFAEGSEEVASDLLSSVFDMVVSEVYDHPDEITKEINDLLEANKGMTRKQAEGQVLDQHMKDLGLSFLGGAVSGLGLSGGNVVRSKAGTVFDTRSSAKAAIENDNLGKILNAAEQVQGGEEYTQQVQELKEEYEAKGTLDTRKAVTLFKLLRNTGVTMVDDVATDEATNVMKEDINERIEKSGEQYAGKDVTLAAQGAAELLTGDGELTSEQREALQKIPEAMEAIREVMTQGTEANRKATERVQQVTQPFTNAMESIREAGRKWVASSGAQQAQETAEVATEEEIRTATGERTNSATEVVADGEFAEIVRKEGDSYVVRTSDGTEKTVDAAEVKATGGTTATVMRWGETNSGIASDRFINTALNSLKYTDVKDTGKFIDEAMNVRLAAYAGESLPQTSLRTEIARTLYQTSLQDAADERAKATAKTVEVSAGGGTATFNGAEYGTTEWNSALKEAGLTKTQRNQAGALAEIYSRIGLNVEFINDTENDEVYGSYNAETGTTTINLAGTNVNGTQHNAMVTAGHEMTHWLEQNSTEAYDQLRQYVLDTMRGQGTNVHQAIMRKVDSYNAMYQQNGSDQVMTLDNAIAEIIADASDQILGNESVIQHIQESRPTLYNSLKNYVKNFVARVRSAISGMTMSASRESMAFLRDTNELAKKWLGAYDEAISAKIEEGENTKKTDNVQEQYSMRTDNQEYMKPFAEQLHDFVPKETREEIFGRDSLLVGATPKLYKKMGLPSLPMTINQKHVGYAIDGDYPDAKYREGHTFSEEEFAKLPEKIANPIAVTVEYEENGTPQLIAYIDMVNKTGDTVVVPFRIGSVRSIAGERMHTNALTTVFAHEDWENKLQEAILNDTKEKNTLLYLDKEKAETLSLGDGTITTVRGAASGLIHRINNEDSNVKTKIQKQTETEQFKRWFGKSKMRNKDGSPQILYHGTNSDTFTVFDPSYIGTAREGDVGFFGRGFYFAYSEGEASAYGRNVIPVYLKIERPFNFQTELNTIDGERTYDYNAGNAVFITNFAEKFRKLSEKFHVTVWENGNSTGNEISLTEFAKQYRDVLQNKTFNVEEVDGAYGKEWLVTADLHEESYTNEDGEVFKWMEYGFQQRYFSEQDARNKATNAYKYMEQVMYDTIRMPKSIDIIQESDFSNTVRKRGYDGIIQSEDGDEAVVFEPTQIKSATDNIGTFIKDNPDIRYSMRATDTNYLQAVENGDMETAQRLVDQAAAQAGYTVKAFHGTARGDRVGNVFLPERATSGPMAFFTDNREIAENYARDKKDTSIEYDEEYGDYYTQFRGTNKRGKNVAIGGLWNEMTMRQRQKITEAASHITEDDDGEIVYDPSAKNGNGGFDSYRLREHGGNAINALIGVWLEDGTLYGEEGRFLDVLKLAGLENVTWNDPDARHEKVYDTWLKIQKPFSTSENFNEAFLNGMEAWWENQDQEKYSRESNAADMWDKNNWSMEGWLERAREDIENGKSHVWTSIPDFVTDYLKSEGFDGIQDVGGKNGGESHTVWIPFSSEQIKSAEAVTYDDQGNVIPLSERFNSGKTDIRYSMRDQGDADVQQWMENLQESDLNTEAEKKLLKEYNGIRAEIGKSREKVTQWQAELDTINRVLAGTEFDTEGRSTAELRDAARKLTINMDTENRKQERLTQNLLNATTKTGYAGMMYRQYRIMNDYINGRSQAEVQQTISAMQQEIARVKTELQERAEKLKKLAEDREVRGLRSFFTEANLQGTANKLKKTYNSSMTSEEIQNRLAEISVKMNSGKDFVTEGNALAGRLMETAKEEGYESLYLNELRGETIRISPQQLKQLKAQNSSLAEVRRALAGTGIRIETGTPGQGTLDMVWDELCDRIPSLDRDAADLDMLEQLVSLVEGEKKASQATAQMTEAQYQEALGQATVDVYEAVAELRLNMPKDAQSRSQIRQIMKYMAEMSNQAEDNAKAIAEMNRRLEELEQKSGAARASAQVLQRDMQKAIDYYSDMVKMQQDERANQERQELILKLGSQATMEVLKERAKWEQQMEKSRQMRELTEDRRKIRKQIGTMTTRLDNLLSRETDQKNIPEHMKPLAREVLGLIVKNDLTGRRITQATQETLLNTQRLLDIWNQQDGRFTESSLDFIGDEDIKEQILDDLAEIETGIGFYNSGSGRNVVQLTSEKAALQRIQKAMSEIYQIIQSERSININDRKVLVADQAEAVQQAMAGSRFRGELTGKAGAGLTTAQRAVVYGNMTPEYFFKNLKNAGMTELWEEYHRGENKNGLELQKAKTRLKDIAEKYHYGDWDVTSRQAVKLSSGTVNMNAEQLMALYATWKRENTIGPEMSQHLTKGGFYVDEGQNEGWRLGREKLNQRPHRVTGADMATVEGLLTEDQKKYVDEVVSVLSNEMSQLGNEASMKMYGIRKFKESYYFPFKMWDGVKSVKSDAGPAGNSDNRMAHKGWSKRRTQNAGTALVIGDFTQTAATHIVEMINYNTMAVAVENTNKVLNYQMEEGENQNTATKRNVRTMFGEAYGKNALDYLDTLQQDLNGGLGQRDNRRTLKESLLSTFKKNAVAGSMSVAAQQPLSYIRASMMISPKYLAEAISPTFWKGSYKEMLDHSGVAVIKDMGRFDMNFGQSAREFIQPEAKTGKGRATYDWISEKSTILPELMDRATWTRMWTACKLEQKAQHPEMDAKSDAFLDMVGERFNDVMRKTQVYDSVLVKSANMRSQNSAMKALTSFMAEPTLTINMLTDAVVNAGEKGGKKNLAEAAATFLLSAALQSVVKAFFSTGRTPDEKKNRRENFLNKLAYNFIGEVNPLGLIPGYSDIVDLLKNGELSDDAMSVVGKLNTIMDSLMSFATGKSGNLWKTVEDSAGQIAQLFTNIPGKNLMRDVRAMYTFISGNGYAQRETSEAVLKWQVIDTLNSNDLLGAINKRLGEAGYSTSNTAYYKRIYQAKKAGDEAAAEEMSEYLTTGKGVKESALASGIKSVIKEDDKTTIQEKADLLLEAGMKVSDVTSWVLDQYIEGKMTREEAEKEYKRINPKATDDEVYFALDKKEFKEETGESGGSSVYYRLYDAMDKGDDASFKETKETLLTHGVEQKDIDSQMKSHILDRYKKGELTQKEAEAQIKKYRPDISSDDLWWDFDRIAYKNETGKDAGSGTYYRLYDAVEENNSNKITSAVKTMTQHGYDNKKIKTQITSKYKNTYLELKAGSAEKVKMKDALTKAYKAVGLTASEAEALINGWKKTEKTGK